MKRKPFRRMFIAGLIATAFACNPLTKLTDTFTNPSARQQYERKLNKETLAIWKTVHQNAITNGVTVPLPYGEKGAFNPGENLAYSYSINLQAGEVLTANVIKDSIGQQVFIEIYQWNGNTYELLANAKQHTSQIEFPIADSGNYKLVVQPEMTADSDFFLTINKKPMYGFPVAGKGNSAIESFWGNVRDGGKRSHEGIDIFAKRGTPVVAVTDGTIGFTGERGIGGKQVWLRTGLFGKSLYYAHLDRIAVSQGESVKAGDTIGFVGNTGNAATTVPHLHFGIYGARGAVDPLPFVYRTADVKADAYPKHFNKSYVITTGKINLRSGPSTNHATNIQLQQNTQLTLLGQHKDWLHVLTASGQTGFVSRKYVRAV